MAHLSTPICHLPLLLSPPLSPLSRKEKAGSPSQKDLAHVSNLQPAYGLRLLLQLVLSRSHTSCLRRRVPAELLSLIPSEQEKAGGKKICAAGRRRRLLGSGYCTTEVRKVRRHAACILRFMCVACGAGGTDGSHVLRAVCCMYVCMYVLMSFVE